MRIRTSTRWVLAVVAWGLTAVCCGLLACSQQPEPPPVAYVGPTLAGDDLGVKASGVSKTGFDILETHSSTGRFPGAVAVARLVKPGNFFKSDNAQRWEVGEIGFEEAITWNSLGNRVPAIREMIVLDKLSTVSPTANIREIAGSARRLEAGLVLIYGPAPVTEDEHAALWGVIVDSTTADKVAFVQAAAGPGDYEPPHADRRKEDRRHWDVNYLARDKFQKQVRQCLLALIDRDRPPATTQPNPWQTKPAKEQPIYLLPPRPTPMQAW